MRSRYNLGLLAAVAAASAMSAASEVLVIDAGEHRPRRFRQPAPDDDTVSRRAAPEPKPPQQASEADNTRLREAAERRYRKAQRQALGMQRGPESA